MNALSYFSVFLVIIVLIFAAITWVDYRLRKITGAEAKFRLVVVVAVYVLAILFVVLAGVLHVSVLLIFAGFAFIVIVAGVIAYVVLVRQ